MEAQDVIEANTATVPIAAPEPAALPENEPVPMEETPQPVEADPGF